MELLHIDLAALALIGLICYSLKTWFLKGNFFHPGLIYTLVNGSIFLIFAFGPYDYQVNIYWYHYYFYALTVIAFIIGVKLGENTKTRRLVKELKLNRKQIWFLSIIALALVIIVPIMLYSLDLGIFSNELTIQDTAAHKIYRANLNAQKREEGISLIKYLVSNLLASFSVIVTSIFLASSLKKKRHLFIFTWLVLALVMSIVLNSRTTLFRSIFAFLIPLLLVKEPVSGKVKLSPRKLKILYKKAIKIVIPIGLLLLLITIIITNVRTEVRSDIKSKDKQKYEYIEYLYRAKQRQWFSSVTDSLPESIVNPIAELSMYAGGTVATGGVTSKIVSEKGWHTWGLRNYFIVHRVLSQLKLDAGLSDIARQNWIKVKNKASLEIPIIESGWISDPGNFIADFGYIGAPLASLITGLLIGWMYSRYFYSGPIINSAVTSILAVPMLLTPALNFFSIHISNSISFLFLFCYYLFCSKKIKIITSLHQSMSEKL